MYNAARRQDVTEYLTIHDVAEQLGRTDRQIRNLVRQRRLGSVKIGRLRRFTQAHVDAYRATYLAAVEVPTEPPVGAGLAA